MVCGVEIVPRRHIHIRKPKDPGGDPAYDGECFVDDEAGANFLQFPYNIGRESGGETDISTRNR